MTPLPLPRRSPGRECMSENRGKSAQKLGTGLTHNTTDDDLMLFNEVQNRERDYFLLHAIDDFEDSLSKLNQFSDSKSGIDVPTRGEKRDLLEVEGEKDDYNWLLTPPETPLFSTLDDDDPQPINPTPGDMPICHPIPVSKSVTDTSYQICRNSGSSQRLSSSTRSSGSSGQARGRSSSVPRARPLPVIQPSIPNRRSCSPPKTISTGARRPSTPTARRTSQSSSSQTSKHGGRGASPVKASNRNSASIKSQGWQMQPPGFNSEAPLNRRASLSDRPILHVRGTSPTSRNGRDLSINLQRKSLPMTGSSSASLAKGQGRDHLNSYGKVFMPSSSDDDEESLHNMTAGISRFTHPRKDVWTNSEPMSFNGKPLRRSPSKSIPRSFDPDFRLMDQHKTPKSLFRPLLSSVPATTFQPILSTNSSLTTSSTTSSEQGVISAVPDAEGSVLEKNDLSGAWESAKDCYSDEEAFLFDKVDEIISDTNAETVLREHSHYDDFSVAVRKNLGGIQNPIVRTGDSINCIIESAHSTERHCDIDDSPVTAVRSVFGKEFGISHNIGNRMLCEDCSGDEHTSKKGLTRLPFIEDENQPRMDIEKGQFCSGYPEFHKRDKRIVNNGQHGRNLELGCDFLACSLHLLDQTESLPSNGHLDIKKSINATQNCRGSACHPSDHAVSLIDDVLEGADNSVLLLQESTKWPFEQRKSFSDTNILCSEPSHLRNNLNSLRRNFPRKFSSADSSIDLGLPRHAEAFAQHQLTTENKALRVERVIDNDAQSICSGNEASTNCYEHRHLRNEFKERISNSKECSGYDSSKEIMLATEDNATSLYQSNLNSSLSSSRSRISVDCISVPSNNTNEISQSSETYKQNNERMRDITVFSEKDDNHTVVSHASQKVILDSITNSFSSFGTMESYDGYMEHEDRQFEYMSPHKQIYLDHSNEHTMPQISRNNVSLGSSEFITLALKSGELAAKSEGSKGQNRSKNWTLEEATNTIIFCSSIIHDLAYRAATIAMEKNQNALPNLCTPPDLTAAFPAKPNPRPPMPQKFDKKKIETRDKFTHRKTDSRGNASAKELVVAPRADIQRNFCNIKIPSLEPKCNCSVM